MTLGLGLGIGLWRRPVGAALEQILVGGQLMLQDQDDGLWYWHSIDASAGFPEIVMGEVADTPPVSGLATLRLTEGGSTYQIRRRSDGGFPELQIDTSPSAVAGAASIVIGGYTVTLVAGTDAFGNTIRELKIA